MNYYKHEYFFARKHSNGFTLIELIVVLLIIGLMAALALPIFSNSLYRLTAKTTVKEIAATLRWARSLAISEKTLVKFFINIPGKEYYVSKLSPNPSEDASAERLIHQKIEDEISIDGFMKYEDSDVSTDDLIEIQFYPQGNSSGGTIIFRTEKSETDYKISIKRISGRVKIEGR